MKQGATAHSAIIHGDTIVPSCGISRTIGLVPSYSSLLLGDSIDVSCHSVV